MTHFATLAAKSYAWLEHASPAQLWEVIEQGNLDAQVGMVNALSGLGALPGPGTFHELLRHRKWAKDQLNVNGDDLAALKAWFVASDSAQAENARQAVRAEISSEVSEMLADLGDGGTQDGQCEGELLHPANAQTPRDPQALFRSIAERRGLIRPGDPLDLNVMNAMFDVVEACARIGDHYGDPEAGGNAGEDIRFNLGPLEP
jgi:hypothetical protein